MNTSNKPKTSGRSEQRRQEIRRNIPKPAADIRQAIRRPEFIRSAIIIFAFLIVLSILVAWAREQVWTYPGLVTKQAQLTRLDYRLENAAATQTLRDEAEAASPFIYIPNTAALDRLHSSLLGLPTAIAGTESLVDVADELKQLFKLDEANLAKVKPFAGPGGPTDAWTKWSDALVKESLIQAPILDPETFQLFSTQAATNRALGLDNGMFERPLRGEPLNVTELQDGNVPPRLREIVRRAGFPASVDSLVATRIAMEARPSLLLDRNRTDTLRTEAASGVEPVMIEHRAGETLYLAGDRISDSQQQEVLREAKMFALNAPWSSRWIPRIGIVSLLAALSIFLAAFTSMTHKRIAKNPLRLVAICLLVALSLYISVLISADAPALALAASLGPLLLSVMILRLAYDQRLAIALGAIQAAIVTLALQETLGWFLLLAAGAGTLVAQLDEVRSRACLIRASSIAAAVSAVGAVVLAMIELPNLSAAWLQVVADAAQAGGVALCVGFLVLGILPSIERVFHITTGMTLAELRDPRRPLLRELQQRAPGTYDHSLQVASIAEAAAEAIGGDGLLVYVGGLYHDIGKMHKPQYFVENQKGGENRHDNLSPAMSLLVIIGHVKDGIELAREYRVPRAIIHFIESHHGTTLVEYFFHAAKQRAEEAGDKESPQEVEFRYPGPKPNTKEAAILMLSDCVESATRAMVDPTPGQIEGLVHDLARKRLLDGQFDQCPMTLAELSKVKEAILARVGAIHHGRIAYPSEGDAKPSEEELERVEAAEAG
ncbi:MAG: HDIG domain-containing protein [Planctomycetes bacterium]|nr:HDIG domain-containing protein [Planctomycetota bacterium]MCP4839522.1 HDIG domain-containing protein [Planctomycetota bacterium]